MLAEIVDDIYEAAFIPELWQKVLGTLSKASGSIGGALLVAGERHPPRWVASPQIEDALYAFSTGDAWKHNDRPARWIGTGYSGFLRDIDFISASDLAIDPMRAELVKFGLGWQLGAVIPMPSGEMAIYSLERPLADGPHDQAAVGPLDTIRPHLARAGLIAGRLGLERAQAAVGALEALGLPAAVIDASARLRTANDLFNDLSEIFSTRARDTLVVAEPSANALFQQAVAGQLSKDLVRSIAIPPTEGHAARVIHLLPLRRAAQDIFSGGDTLVVATSVTASSLVPSPTLLSGLFDLAPAEAKLAAALATGVALKQAAAEQNIRTTTARYYLEQIFRKTGTHRQGELVALVKSTLPLHNVG